MPAIGITGGISTGKSTFCDCLREILPAAKFFNADEAAREFVDLDPEVRKEIEQQFGAEIYSANGDLNRARPRSVGIDYRFRPHLGLPFFPPDATIAPMSKLSLADVLELSVPERIQLVEDIWDSIATLPEPVPLTPTQREEIDRRLEDYRQHPEGGSAWEEVRKRILRAK